MLIEAFKQVPDFRDRKGQTYRLWSLLALVLVGFLCGRRGLRAVYRMGRTLPVQQRLRLGFRRDKMPCHSTLTETMRAVDADCLAALLGRAVVRENTPSQASRHIAIDGKTLRGSKDANGDAEHCLSAFAHAVQKVLGHTASRGKGMEIPDALALLERIDLTDKVVTGDAMFCQRSITEKIVERGGDYVLPVKGNQKNLLEDIQTAFETPVFPPHTLAGG
jgi:DDE_Tnp_1-associated/Transposase DDE domain